MDAIKAVKGNTIPVHHGVDCTGRVFGNWRVLGPMVCERYPTGRNYRTKWLCQCSCGSDPKWVDKYNIVTGRSTGCSNCAGLRNSGDRNGNWKGCGDMPGWQFYRAAYGARARGIPMLVEIEDLDKLWRNSGGVCALTGLAIELGKTASLDRIDSSKAYTVDNLQWVHKEVNKMKNDLPQARFVELCGLVTKHRKDKGEPDA